MSVRCAFVLAFVVAGSARAEEPFRFPAARHGDKAELKYLDKIPVLTVGGTPEEIGTAVGTLALKPASRVLGYPRDLLKLRKVDFLWHYFKGQGKTLYKQFPAESRDELEAIVSSAKAEHDLVVAGNTFFDLKKAFACSALLVEKERSSTGGPMLSRNLDYPSMGYIHHYSLVTVYRPKGKLAFVSVGFPGLVGVLSGMNEAGLAVGVLEVFDLKEGEPFFDIKGVPYGLCLRRALEEARTIDEAKKVLESLPRTVTINVAIADRNEVAVLEVSPGQVVKRSSSKGVCVTTNHFCSAPLQPKRMLNIDRTYDRYARLDSVSRGDEKLTPDELRQHLDAVNLGSLTLQTMVFEPTTLKLHLAIGRIPASKGKLQEIELAPLLRGNAAPAKAIGRK